MGKISILKGDITKVKTDAIVNAANTSLLGGGGVDGAIHRAGGPAILQECRMINGCKTGEAVVTTAGNLPADMVIHTVGPVWNGGTKDEPDLLRAAYFNSLERAREKKARTVAFPNISTGIYGYPKEQAAEIAVSTVKEYLSQHELPEQVVFVCFDEENESIYRQLI
ncbi:O-acetyl-ADP-ribose deacetylase [Roseivirga sp. BDSF3-8]|uniref:O-acetyl-ADP-ribose deacetylase n=1 Tax=Roseivirga sp. BDSF3-8 TaxID=3241598 RepID=UPI0035324964